ncbi:MAG: UDP-N-acetylmuramoyl-L-alanine--D-glutamate ligase [Ignavibacteriaceae bacterium]|nr:UDP-N-acetylmuramoyl-L-alanine--D-glutamate ligase [Ignavibacteriaceae bacterium]
MNIEGKKISIIGAVRSGIGAAKLVKKLGGFPFVSDAGNKDKLADSIKILKELKLDYEVGVHSSKLFDCAVMIVSPGVPTNSPVVKTAIERNIKVISEVEFAALFCKGKIIAITGTNGKTTTTTLCGYVFNNCGKKTYTAGNIGNAFSEIALDVKEDEFVALEVSSFQLDFTETFKPAVSIILNITPDHLNRYDNKIENYIASKLKILKNQSSTDRVILNKDDKTLMNSIASFKTNAVYFSLSEVQANGIYCAGNDIILSKNSTSVFTCKKGDISLPGNHNLYNAMAVISAAKIFELDNKKIIEALGSFQGVEHRLEFVRELEGVKFINDSKATNVDSVWYALQSYDNSLFLILGGQDKGNDYNRIKDFVIEKVKKIYAIGSSADKVFNFFHKEVKVEITKKLEDAVLAASKEARQGDIVLLSPACASFDMFENYEHRGKVFKEAVNKL